MEENKKGFTLVEVMTVVIILSVLSSIAFLSLQGYVRDSRDSVRAMDVKTMATSLDLFDLQTGFFPTPTDAVPISFSGQTAWLQGTFGESVFRNVERLSFIPLDPLTEQPYAYSTTSNRFSYELGGIYEGGQLAVNPLVSQAQASGEREAYAFTEGNYNGAFVGIDDGDQRIILASPTIFSTDLEETDFLKLFQAGKIVMENEKNLPGNYVGYGLELEAGKDEWSLGDPIFFSGDIKELRKKALEVLSDIQTTYAGVDVSHNNYLAEIMGAEVDIENPSYEALRIASKYLFINGQ